MGKRAEKSMAVVMKNKYGSNIMRILGEAGSKIRKYGGFFRWVDSLGQVLFYPHPLGEFTSEYVSLPKEYSYPEGRYEIVKIGNLYFVPRETKEPVLPIKILRNNKKKYMASNYFLRLVELMPKGRFRYDYVHWDGRLFVYIWDAGLRKGRRSTITYSIRKGEGIMKYLSRERPEMYFLYGKPFIKLGTLRGKHRLTLQKLGFVRIPIACAVHKIEKLDFHVNINGHVRYYRTRYRMFPLLREKGLTEFNPRPHMAGKYRVDAVLLFEEDEEVKVAWKVVQEDVSGELDRNLAEYLRNLKNAGVRVKTRGSLVTLIFEEYDSDMLKKVVLDMEGFGCRLVRMKGENLNILLYFRR